MNDTNGNQVSPTGTRVESAPSDGELRVVVGIDGSDSSKRALTFAAQEAVMRGALLQIVCAYQIPASSGWVTVPLAPLEDFAADTVRESLAYVHQHYPQLNTKGETRHGPAGLTLIAAAEGANLLVVGSRGHSELTELLIGSVSETCAHHATCPVAIVR